MKKTIIVAALTIAALAIAACSGNKAKKIIGTWSNTENTGIIANGDTVQRAHPGMIVLQFDPDGRGNMTMMQRNKDIIYAVEGDSLSLNKGYDKYYIQELNDTILRFQDSVHAVAPDSTEQDIIFYYEYRRTR